MEEKVEFVGKWMKGIGIGEYCGKMEKKKAIKVAADIAMAWTRKGRRSWSRAVIANAWRDTSSRVMTERIIGSSQCHTLINASSSSSNSNSMMKMKRRNRNRMILMGLRSRTRRVLGKKRIKRERCRCRTERLKRVVPGGEGMDSVTLLEETLDYIQSLTSQVHLMRSLLTLTTTLP